MTIVEWGFGKVIAGTVVTTTTDRSLTLICVILTACAEM